jgi:uncharacterized membrane protein
MNKISLKTKWLLGGILLLGLVLRLWNINQSLWWDEIWSTLFYAKADSVWGTISKLGVLFNNHILYSVLCKISITIFGENEISARIPALMLGLFGIGAVYMFGRTYWNSSIGLTAAYLTAISIFHIDHSTEARGYSGLLLFSILSTNYFLKALPTRDGKSWALYILCTVTAYYFHVIMIAVSISQFLYILLLWLGKQIGKPKTPIQSLYPYFKYTAIAAIITLTLYLPIMKTFIKNMGKVSVMEVDRFPFLQDLANSICPGILSPPGLIIYAFLFCAGLFFLIKKNAALSLLTVIIIVAPLTIYILANPSFVFKRYFLYALPFCLLIVSSGIHSLSNLCRTPLLKNLVFMVLLLALTGLQTPQIIQFINHDRQNYREAIYYIEDRKAAAGSYVFSIGYAGQHFNYYSREPVATPQTYEEFRKHLSTATEGWCPITAWLPTLRPPNEDKQLFSEEPEQEKIHRYIVENFTLEKTFQDKYMTTIYVLKN